MTVTPTGETYHSEGTFSDITLKADILVKDSSIKRISAGGIFKGEPMMQIGNINLEDNGYFNITIHNTGIENVAAICSAVPLFINEIITEINK